MRPGAPGRWRAGLAILLSVIVLLFSSCTYAKQEPGLFRHSHDEPSTESTSEPSPSPRPGNGNPNLPVLGEAVWTSGEGLYLSFRIAVHAVRRMTGATVLDWSVTPLLSSGYIDGEPVPPEVDFGLMRPGDGRLEIALLDPAGRRVFRPLSDKVGSLQACVCTPPIDNQDRMRFGRTLLLQAAFPPLPQSLSAVDVDIATVPPFFHVPVTPAGMVPVATTAVDLARPAVPSAAVANTPDFTYGRAQQTFFLAIEAVYTTSTFTAIWWTIQSVGQGPGLDRADLPPIADAQPPSHPGNPVSAGGPQIIRPGGEPPLRTRLVTARSAGADIEECLCTDLRDWASSLRHQAERVSVATILPPLAQPRETQQVDIAFPGLPTIKGVVTTAASNIVFLSAAPSSHPATTWTLRPHLPQPGWLPSAWPTPVPDPVDIGRLRPVVDSIVR